jgi:GNAT superfamily N-acetyltransferase
VISQPFGRRQFNFIIMEVGLHLLGPGPVGASAAPEVARFEAKVWGPKQSMQQPDLERQLASQRSIVLLARSCGQLVGYILCTTSSGNMHIVRLGVLPAFRGKSIGSRLLRVCGDSGC